MAFRPGGGTCKVCRSNLRHVREVNLVISSPGSFRFFNMAAAARGKSDEHYTKQRLLFATDLKVSVETKLT